MTASSTARNPWRSLICTSYRRELQDMTDNHVRACPEDWMKKLERLLHM